MGKIRVRKKRKPIPSVTSIEFFPRLKERIETLPEDQELAMEKQVAISTVFKIKERDDVMFDIEQNPEAYLAAEELAFEMMDFITNASKKFRHLGMEQKFYWMCMKTYTELYTEYFEKRRIQEWEKELEKECEKYWG